RRPGSRAVRGAGPGRSGSVSVLAAVELQHVAGDADDAQGGADAQQPPGVQRRAEEDQGHREAADQRPPAPRGEVTVLPRRLVLLGVRVVLRTRLDLAAQLEQVAAREGEQADQERERHGPDGLDRKSTRLNSSHVKISYAVFCLKKKIQ